MEGLYYVQTNILCTIVLLVISLTLSRTNVLPARRVAFTRLIFIAIIVCLSDIFAWYSIGKGSKILLHISNMIYYASITWESYAWLNYVDLRIKSLEDNVRKRRFDAIPLLIMLAIIVTNPLTHLLFSINDDYTYSRENGVFIHWIISFGYLIYATVRVIIKIRNSGAKTEKRLLAPLTWFVIPPAVAALLQMLFYGLTSTQCGLTISILVIAVRYLSDESYQDALTGMNNRRSLEKYLTERLQRGSMNLTVFMCDIDRFKSINDTLGHAAGDLVIRRMSDALKEACSSFRLETFVCRYGGDEFVICGQDFSEEDQRELVRIIENSIENINFECNDEMCFSISIGNATNTCKKYQHVEELISLADAAMYEVKNKKKAGRREA